MNAAEIEVMKREIARDTRNYLRALGYHCVYVDVTIEGDEALIVPHVLLRTAERPRLRIGKASTDVMPCGKAKRKTEA